MKILAIAAAIAGTIAATACTMAVIAVEWVGAAIRTHRQRRARRLHPSTEQTYRWDGHVR